MPETRASEIEALRAELEQLRALMAGRSNNIYSIPDPIKNLSEFSGQRSELSSWLREVSELYEMFKIKGEAGQPDSLSSVYVRAIKNKIKGNARAILCANNDPDTIEEIKNILIEQYGDQRDFPTNISGLFQIRKGDKNHLRFFNEIKELNTRLKANLTNHPLSGKQIIDVLTVTRYLDNIGEPLASIIRLSKPKTLEEAYHSVCINQNAEYRTRPAKTPYKSNFTSNGDSKPPHKLHTYNNNNRFTPGPASKKPMQQTKNKTEYHANEAYDQDDECDNDDDDNNDHDVTDSVESREENFHQREEDWTIT